MSFLSVFRLALVSLNRNKTRSFLTALGIIIAVGSVITIVGLVQGANASIQGEISKMGSSLIMIMPGSGQAGGHRMGMGTMTTLTEDDAHGILSECPSVVRVSPIVRSGAQVIFGSQNWSTSVMGVGMQYLDVRAWKLESGDYFTEGDLRNAAKVCVLGKGVADNLFGSMDPVGKTIRIKKIPFEVLGVLESRGQTGMGQDQDDVIIAPLSTVQRRLMGVTHIQMIMASGASDDVVEKAKEEIAKLLRRKHKIVAGKDDDFNIQTQADIAAMAGSTLKVVALLLAGIASVSLMVGGIGIMNIMLVSVTERTREIGIRMAIGARGRDILTQFLVEAMALSSVGGLFGIGFGVALTNIIIKGFTQWEATVSIPAILVSVIFSAVVGIFFGLYPAWKASQLDPIEALRFE